MTKKEKILLVALELFADKGYHATSTSKVAKAAGVSEGLIFRHFTNKEGLLNAILDNARQMANEIYEQILNQKDPKAIIRDVIQIPFCIKKEHYHFWKLIYALKWQADQYDDRFTADLKKGLKKAFKSLGYPDPNAEAEIVLLLLDGISTAIILRKPKRSNAILQSLLAKYEL